MKNIINSSPLLTVLLMLSVLFPLSAYAAADDNGLTLIERTTIDQRTTDLSFASDKLAVEAKVRVVLPSNYAANDKRYPVIYLLHGGGGSHADWTSLGATDATEAKDVILVQPGAGGGSWFVDAELPGQDDIRPLWETYITSQLIPWIDNHLRTIDSRSGRAIAGLSMGGYGTMMLASRHPHLFISASSFSGAIDLADSSALINTDPKKIGENLTDNLVNLITHLPQALIGLPGFLGDLPTNLMHLPNNNANPIINNLIDPTLDNVPFISNWVGVSPLIEMRPPYTVFGPFPLDQQTRLSHNPVTLAANLRGMHLSFYYGNGTEGTLDGDSNAVKMPGPDEFMGWIQEDRVEGMNQRMEAKLNQLGIAYENCQQADYYIGNGCAYGNGMHSGGYWARSFIDELPAILNAFNNPSAYPSPAASYATPELRNVVANGDFESASLDTWQCGIRGNCGVSSDAVEAGDNGAWVQAQTLPLSVTDPVNLPEDLLNLLNDLPGTLEASGDSLTNSAETLVELATSLSDDNSSSDLQALLGAVQQQIYQPLEVVPFTLYHLTAWVKTSGMLVQGELGVRTSAHNTAAAIPAGLTLHKVHLDGDFNEFTKIEFDVDSGANDVLELYAGFFAIDKGPMLQIDTVSLLPVIPTSAPADDSPTDNDNVDETEDETGDETGDETSDDLPADSNSGQQERPTAPAKNNKSGGSMGAGLLLLTAVGLLRRRRSTHC